MRVSASFRPNFSFAIKYKSCRLLSSIAILMPFKSSVNELWEQEPKWR
jgi:hypothetical protein